MNIEMFVESGLKNKPQWNLPIADIFAGRTLSIKDTKVQSQIGPISINSPKCDGEVQLFWFQSTKTDWN
jgi:hypothetical protein